MLNVSDEFDTDYTEFNPSNITFPPFIAAIFFSYLLSPQILLGLENGDLIDQCMYIIASCQNL
jgi:hypothetical protein